MTWINTYWRALSSSLKCHIKGFHVLQYLTSKFVHSVLLTSLATDFLAVNSKSKRMFTAGMIVFPPDSPTPYQQFQQQSPCRRTGAEFDKQGKIFPWGVITLVSSAHMQHYCNHTVLIFLILFKNKLNKRNLERFLRQPRKCRVKAGTGT